MHLDRPAYVSDLIVYLLHGLGIDYVTLNPGATTVACMNPWSLMVAIRRPK